MVLKPVNRAIHPDAPDAAELASIRPGRVVRLCLANGSYFWARVLSGRRTNGTFTAETLDTLPGMCRGSLVVFVPSAG